MLLSEKYQREIRKLFDTEVSIESYKIGNQFFCHVANRDPGATIARAQADTREKAVQDALLKATERLNPRL
jgi:hypothetical protein